MPAVGLGPLACWIAVCLLWMCFVT